MTKFNLLGDNTIQLAETLQPAPSHLANKRMTLAFFDNNDAAHGARRMAKTANHNSGSASWSTVAPTSCALTWV